MYRLHIEKCRDDGIIKPASLQTYRNAFHAKNLKFHTPMKDQCATCEKYKNANDEVKEVMEDEYKQHIDDKDKARVIRNENKVKATNDDSYMAFNFDLEAVLHTPCTKVLCIIIANWLLIMQQCIT